MKSWVLAVITLFTLSSYSIEAQTSSKIEGDSTPGSEVTLIPIGEIRDGISDRTDGTSPPESHVRSASMALSRPSFSPEASQGLVGEVEPNDTSATATPLGGSNVVRVGNIYPNSDVDYWSFSATAGNRIYVATMTAATAPLASSDTVLDLLGTDGVTVIETDDNDGVFAALASSIAGAVIPVTGTYFIRVRAGTGTSQIRPYHLHFRLQSGSPPAEIEPNDTPAAAQPLPPSGWIAGALSSAADMDYYSLALNAGDTVYLSLDADPERDAVEWNPRLGIGFFGDGAGVIISGNDSGSAGPDSEAVFMTVKSAGTYYAHVAAASTTFGTYHLSVSVHPATAQGVNCATYTSTTAFAIPDQGLASSPINVPGHPRIGDLDVSIQLSHTFMTDLDVNLRSPQGNDVGLFTDIGNPAQTQMDVTVDDEAGIPFGPVTVVRGMIYQPEPAYRLSWFDGEDAGGTWTLDIRDDTAGDAGTLLGWSLTVCEPSPTVCSGTPVTVYESDFETGSGGFTHSGTADEWERGLPSFAPITTCNSGTSCWKTDLDNTYDPSSNQDLTSPTISLSGLTGGITASWALRYQMDNASSDHAFVEVHEVPSANPRRLFEWLDGTMTDGVGVGTSIQESAGWGLMSADISAYAGRNISLRYHLDSDAAGVYAGLAVDDVKVTWCCTPAACDDTNACTTDACDSLGCVHTPVGGPGEASGLLFAPNKQTLSWNAVPLASRYDVVRGNLSSLPVGPGGGDEICFNNISGPSVSDAAVPAIGAGFWYLARAENACGSGGYGTTSGGSPRSTATCP